MADTSIKGHDQTAIHAICIKVIRMKTSAILLALAIVALYGCTYSVHPILTDADLTQDVDLSGTWQQQLPSDSNPERKPLVIECDGYHNNTSYDAVRLQEEFTLQIGKVGDGRYLQFIRSDFGTTKDGALACLPVYGFARFELKGEELHVFPVNEGNIIKLLKKKLPQRNSWVNFRTGSDPKL